MEGWRCGSSRTCRPAVLRLRRWRCSISGASATSSNGNVIDLGGLVDRDYLPYLLQERAAAYLYQHNVRYVVLPTEVTAGDAFFTGTLALDRAHGAVLTPLHSVCADAAMARMTMAATSAAFPCQTVYSIDYIAPATLATH